MSDISGLECREAGPLKVLSSSLQWSTVRVTGLYALTATAGTGPAPVPDPCPDDNGFYINGSSLCGRNPPPPQPVVLPDDLVTYANEGMGWFFTTKDGIIVTAASNVLIDPRLLANNNRYPFVTPDQPLPTGFIPEVPTQVSRIIVSYLYKKKNCNEAFVRNCDAKLLYVDPAGNIAYLKLCTKKGVRCNPPLELSTTCATPKGSSAYTVMGAQDFYTGTVVNQYYSSPEFQAEHLKTDFNYDVLYPGAPIVNQNCKVIGMLTTDNSGPGADFLDFVLDKMSNLYNLTIDGTCGKKGRKLKRRFTPIEDSIGCYLVFRKVYFGVLWDNVSALTYTTSYDITNGEENMIFNSRGEFDELTACARNRGIILTNYAGNVTPSVNTLPGATDTPVAPIPSLLNKALNVVIPGSTILLGVDNANKGPFFGDSPSMCRAPGLFTWKIDPCKKNDVYFVNTPIPNNATASKQSLDDLLEYIPLAIDFPFFQVEVPTFPVPPGPAVVLPFTSSPL